MRSATLSAPRIQTMATTVSTQPLSAMQVAPTALDTSENILMCAPTGAGKTNVAMLAILHTLSLYRDAATGAIDVDKFKIIYVAPMKVCAPGVGARLSDQDLRFAVVWLVSVITRLLRVRACVSL